MVMKVWMITAEGIIRILPTCMLHYLVDSTCSILDAALLLIIRGASFEFRSKSPTCYGVKH